VVAGLEEAEEGVCFLLAGPPDGGLLLEVVVEGLGLARLLPEGKRLVASPLLSLCIMKTRRCHLPLFLTAEQHVHTQSKQTLVELAPLPGCRSEAEFNLFFEVVVGEVQTPQTQPSTHVELSQGGCVLCRAAPPVEAVFLLGVCVCVCEEAGFLEGGVVVVEGVEDEVELGGLVEAGDAAGGDVCVCVMLPVL
jgi:hypothetical protein